MTHPKPISEREKRIRGAMRDYLNRKRGRFSDDMLREYQEYLRQRTLKPGPSDVPGEPPAPVKLGGEPF